MMYFLPPSYQRQALHGTYGLPAAILCSSITNSLHHVCITHR